MSSLKSLDPVALVSIITNTDAIDTTCPEIGGGAGREAPP